MLINHTLSVSGGQKNYAIYGSLAYTDNQNYSPGQSKLIFKDSVKKAEILDSKLNYEYKEYQSLISASDKLLANIENEFAPATPEKKKEVGFEAALQEKYDKSMPIKRHCNINS